MAFNLEFFAVAFSNSSLFYCYNVFFLPFSTILCSLYFIDRIKEQNDAKKMMNVFIWLFVLFVFLLYKIHLIFSLPQIFFPSRKYIYIVFVLSSFYLNASMLRHLSVLVCRFFQMLFLRFFFCFVFIWKIIVYWNLQDQRS